MKRRVSVTVSGVLLFCGVLMGPARAQETTAVNPEIERLKAQLAAQQEQIDQLRRTLEDQKKVLEDASRPKPPSLGEVASTTPVIPPSSVAPALHPSLAGTPGPQAASDVPPSPLQLKIGNASITPIGFMDFTAVFRSRDVGSSIGTNFGATPYVNAASGFGKLSELRLSAQNSRIGARIDTVAKGVKVLAYWESDFLGTQATNAAVSTHSDSFRMRLYWVDLKKDKWEILAGQSWSMLTPGRKGISPLPGDLFYSQDVDTNYQVGLTWTRAPQFRLVYHPSNIVTFGMSLESPEQYGGGSSGGGAITLVCSANNPNLTPAAPNKSCTPLNTAISSEINLGAATYNTPNLHPDVQAKLAFDPMVNGKLMHVEFGGVFSSFKTYNPTTGSKYTKQGGGGQFNFNFELAKNFRLIGNQFLSDGEGRYLFGQAPDLIIRPDGSPSPVHSASTVDGFEYQVHNSQFYAYYGGIYIGRDVAIDTSNNLSAGDPTKPPAKYPLIGYGYKGSPNSQNRSIQEATFGLTQTFWKSPEYGALSLMLQYSYLLRNPWAVASDAPKNANNNMVWLNLRYTLPGAPPSTPK